MRVIASDGRLVCLMPPEALRHFDAAPDWSLIATRPISLSGRHPVIAAAEPRHGRRLRRSGA